MTDAHPHAETPGDHTDTPHADPAALHATAPVGDHVLHAADVPNVDRVLEDTPLVEAPPAAQPPRTRGQRPLFKPHPDVKEAEWHHRAIDAVSAVLLGVGAAAAEVYNIPLVSAALLGPAIIEGLMVLGHGHFFDRHNLKFRLKAGATAAILAMGVVTEGAIADNNVLNDQAVQAAAEVAGRSCPALGSTLPDVKLAHGGAVDLHFRRSHYENNSREDVDLDKGTDNVQGGASAVLGGYATGKVPFIGWDLKSNPNLLLPTNYTLPGLNMLSRPVPFDNVRVPNCTKKGLAPG